MGFAPCCMMNQFEQELRSRLAALENQGLYRRVRAVDSPQGTRISVGGRMFLNFSSNDYLGLANEASLKEAAQDAIERYGTGTGASRLICGSLAPFAQLEETLAEFKGAEAALSFSTGYAAALGTICALAGRNDVIVLDRLVHASIVDGARLSGARLRVFPHNDVAALEFILRRADSRRPSGSSTASSSRMLIITESVFSMDGDQAPLREIAEVKDKYGAWLMVDEAHATGLFGMRRSGLAEALGISDRIEVHMGTLGKALGASGGYICGSRVLIDYLINKARSFIFSTAPVPAAAAAAQKGVELAMSEEGEIRCRALWQRVSEAGSGINGKAHQQESARSCSRSDNRLASAILPIMVGDEARAVEAADALRQRGIFIPAIRFPTVARGSARLRLTLSAAHTAEDVQQLISTMQELRLITGPEVMR